MLLAAWCAWSVLSAVVALKGLATGAWRRPRWWVHMTSALLFLAALAWLRGALAGGLDTEKLCRFSHHTVYDPAYRERHPQEPWRLFPLHNRCNASHDLVPAWVNPTVGILAVCTLAALCGTVWSLTVRRKRHDGTR
ncbi:hypothetical protein VO63_06795 [Streptomyces showdoensis]|uniref:Uncharacterized protein n=1 Tax=Streptomyces showdoensis TaxID=68268 RepID=A0A2P2GSY2_STREW|nr:hypothetical protein VO63_06795 [Streptomyces showdoensis]